MDPKKITEKNNLSLKRLIELSNNALSTSIQLLLSDVNPDL